MTERSRDVFDYTHELFLGPDVDVREDDFVRVTSSSGTVIMPEAHVKLRRLVFDGTTAHHVECLLLAQQGA